MKKIEAHDSNQTSTTSNPKGDTEMTIHYRPSLNAKTIACLESAIQYAKGATVSPDLLLYETFAGNCLDRKQIVAAWRLIADKGFRFCDLYVPAIYGTKKQRVIAEKIVKAKHPHKLWSIRFNRDDCRGIIGPETWYGELFHRPAQTLRYATMHGFREKALRHAFTMGTGSKVMAWAFDRLHLDGSLKTADYAAAYWRLGFNEHQSALFSREEIGRIVLESDETRHSFDHYKTLIEGAKELDSFQSQVIARLSGEIGGWTGISRLRGLFLLLRYCQPESRTIFWNAFKEELRTSPSWQTATLGVGAFPKLSDMLLKAKELGVTDDQEQADLVVELYGQLSRRSDQELVRIFLENTACITDRLNGQLFDFLSEEAASIINGYHAHLDMRNLKMKKADFIDKVLSIQGSAEWENKAYEFMREFSRSLPKNYAESTWSTVLNHLVAFNSYPTKITAAMKEIIEQHHHNTNLVVICEYPDYFDLTSAEQAELVSRAAELIMSNPRSNAEDRSKAIPFLIKKNKGGDVPVHQPTFIERRLAA